MEQGLATHQVMMRPTSYFGSTTYGTTMMLELNWLSTGALMRPKDVTRPTNYG